jgi:hypothetical protein
VVGKMFEFRALEAKRRRRNKVYRVSALDGTNFKLAEGQGLL